MTVISVVSYVTIFKVALSQLQDDQKFAVFMSKSAK
jgi:hypothetical protein